MHRTQSRTKQKNQANKSHVHPYMCCLGTSASGRKGSVPGQGLSLGCIKWGEIVTGEKYKHKHLLVSSCAGGKYLSLKELVEKRKDKLIWLH